MATPKTLHLLIDGDALHRSQKRRGQQIGKFIATDFARVLDFAGSEAFGPRNIVAAFHAREAPAAQKLYGHLVMCGVALNLTPERAPWQMPKDALISALEEVAEDPDADVIFVGNDGYGGAFADVLRRIAGSSGEGGFLRKLATGGPPARQAGVLHLPGENGIQGVHIRSWDLAEIGGLIERELIPRPDPRPTPAADRVASAVATATSDILVIVDVESLRNGLLSGGGSYPEPVVEANELDSLAGYIRSKAAPGARVQVGMLPIRPVENSSHRPGERRSRVRGWSEIVAHDPGAEIEAAIALAAHAKIDELWVASHRDWASRLAGLAEQRRGELYIGVLGLSELIEPFYAATPSIEVHDLGRNSVAFGRHLPRDRRSPVPYLAGPGGDRILDRLFREAS